MVRLVFRPYTQVLRSICTSEPLRASTRVSSGFALLRNSSPSFGSQRTRSTARPSENIRLGRRCPPEGVSTFTFIARSGFPPKHSRARSTPWSVFQDGSFKAITPASQACAGYLGPARRSRRRAITRPEPPPSPRQCPPHETDAGPSDRKVRRAEARLSSGRRD